MHSIKSDRLEAGVLFAIQQQVHLAVAYSELVSRINSAPLKKSKDVNDLEQMANLYSTAEQQNVDDAASLSSGVIS